MFGIKIGNEWLELPSKFKIRLRLESSLFQTKYANTAYSFPFSLPDSDKNRRLTNFVSDVQVKSDSDLPINCVLVSGIWQWPCLLWVDRSLFNNNIQVSLKVIISDTYDKYLPDLDYGGKRNTVGDSNPLPENIEVTNNYTRSKDRDYYWGMYYNAAPVLTPDQGVINDIDSTGTFDIIASTLGFPETSRYTPMPYLNYVLRVIAKDFGVGITGSWFDDAELDSLCIFNNRTIERFFVAPPLRPSGWIWEDLNLKYHVPVMKVNDFFGDLKNVFCLLIEHFNGKLNIVPYKDILKNFVVNDWTLKSERVYERVKGPYSNFELKIVYDEADGAYKKYVKPVKLLRYLGELSLTPPLAIEGDYYKDTNLNNYYVYYQGSWRFYTFDYFGINVDAGGLIFETKFNTPIYRSLEAPPKGRRLPWIEMDSEGQYTSMGETDIKDYGPKLVFARGWYDNQIFDGALLSTRIPVITSDDKDYYGTSWGNYSLRYNGTKGLYNVFWADFLKMAKENDSAFFTLQMSDSDLSNWTFGEWIRIGGQVFLPKALDIELSEIGVETCICEAIRKHE